MPSIIDPRRLRALVFNAKGRAKKAKALRKRAISPDTPAIDIALTMEDRSGASTDLLRAAPHTFSVPFPQGERFGVSTAGLGDTRVSLHPLAYWRDGSVRVALAECIPPSDLSASSANAYTLSDASTPIIAGTLNVTGLGAEVNASSYCHLKGTDADEDLFYIESGGGSGGLRTGENATLLLQTTPTDSDYAITTSTVESQQLERLTEASALFKQIRLFKNSAGKGVFRVITRLTAYRNTEVFRVQQTIECIAGFHDIDEWYITLPLNAPGSTVDVATSTTASVTKTGDFTFRVIEDNAYNDDGTPTAGASPGVLKATGTVIAPTEGWRAYPIGYERVTNDLRVELMADETGTTKTQQNRALDPGMSLTRTFFVAVGGGASEAIADYAKLSDQPIVTYLDPAYYQKTLCYGKIALVDSDTHDTSWQTSITSIQGAGGGDPDNVYGALALGDFPVPGASNNSSYAGTFYQEYDPSVAWTQHFLRAGEADSHDWIVRCAYNYVDVIAGIHGGMGQHRTTRYTMDAALAELLAFGMSGTGAIYSDVGDELGSAPRTVASVNSAIRALSYYQADMGTDIDTFLANKDTYWPSMTDSEVENNLYRLVAWDFVQSWGNTYAAGSFPVGTAGRPTQVVGDTDLGYRHRCQLTWAYELGWAADMDADNWSGNPGDGYDPYGAGPGQTNHYSTSQTRYGWDFDYTYPVHTQPFAPLDLLFQGGHLQPQGVIFAYWLTGERRFLEGTVRIANFAVDTLVPQEIAWMEDKIDTAASAVHARRIGWLGLYLVWAHAALRRLDPEGTGAKGIAGKIGTAIADMVDTVANYNGGFQPENIKGSVSSGYLTEFLVDAHRDFNNTEALDVAETMVLDHSTAGNLWDAVNGHVVHNYGDATGNAGMAARVMYGWASVEKLRPNAALNTMLNTAWTNLAASTSGTDAKLLGMYFRTRSQAKQLMSEI